MGDSGKQGSGNAHQRAVAKAKQNLSASSVASPEISHEVSDDLKRPRRGKLLINLTVALLTLIAANLFNWTQFWEYFREPLEVTPLTVLRGKTGFYYGGRTINGLRTGEGGEPQAASPIGTLLHVRLRNRSSWPVKVTGYNLSVTTPSGETVIDPLSGIPGINGKVFLLAGDKSKIAYFDLDKEGFDLKASTAQIAPRSDITGVMFFKDEFPDQVKKLTFSFMDSDGKTHVLKAEPPKGYSNVHGYTYDEFVLGISSETDVPPGIKQYLTAR